MTHKWLWQIWLGFPTKEWNTDVTKNKLFWGLFWIIIWEICQAVGDGGNSHYKTSSLGFAFKDYINRMRKLFGTQREKAKKKQIQILFQNIIAGIVPNIFEPHRPFCHLLITQ